MNCVWTTATIISNMTCEIFSTLGHVCKYRYVDVLVLSPRVIIMTGCRPIGKCQMFSSTLLQVNWLIEVQDTS